MEPKYIQIGVVALRDPATKGFLPAVPLYIEATEQTTQAEVALCRDIGRDLAKKFRQYVEGTTGTGEDYETQKARH